MMKFYLHKYVETEKIVCLNYNEQSFCMKKESEDEWSISIDDDVDFYYYSVENVTGDLLELSLLKRLLPTMKSKKDVEVYDDFLVGADSVFQTIPFTEVFFPHKKQKVSIGKSDWVLQIFAPNVAKNQQLAMVGRSPFLGDWQAKSNLLCKYVGKGWWSVVLSGDLLNQELEYKFVFIDKKTKVIDRWEEGENRINTFVVDDKTHILNLCFRQNYDFHAYGTAVPVFSLRSQNGWGVGEFLDIKNLVDWASSRGMKAIQILPINDTTRTKTDADSYPYSANSIYALNPLYLNCPKIGVLSDEYAQKKFLKKATALNKKDFVDYGNVLNLKLDYLQKLYKQEYGKLVENKEFVEFCAENKNWLLSYAVFSCLRDKFSTSNFSDWGDYSTYDVDEIEKFALENKFDVAFYYFLQFHLSKQLREACDYAHRKGVMIKGDLPIGISSDSVDAWISPQLFNLDQQAGAPPDDFSRKGQNWGFPTYRWEEMQKDGFLWWKNRFQNMQTYFDAFRIDHILGFFRIWEIEKSASWGVLGTFNSALPMSVSEIEQFGFLFDAERFAKPFISEGLLDKLFSAEEKDFVKDMFLNQQTFSCFSFKSDFESQQKMSFYFKKNPIKSTSFQQNVLQLYTEVLFVEDHYKKGFFHPRINAFETEVFRQLSFEGQDAFSKIHYHFYYERHNDFWRKKALEKLPVLLQNVGMLVCGEDLGMIPQCVPDVMSLLNILTLEVQRMPKKCGEEFVDPQQTPYLSVCTTGTHDTSTLRAWWEENADSTERYYHQMLHLVGKVPEKCTIEIAKNVIEQQLKSRSMFTILPVQDFLAADEEYPKTPPKEERINNPANPLHFWCYRLPKELK